MKTKRRKIVIVGGGSYAWAPFLVKDMLLKEEIRDSEFVLLDIDPDACGMVATFLEKLNGTFRTGASFVPTTDQEAALKDAHYIIIAISTGGLDAMQHDLAIPQKFGIYHTVGDTSGPGGWARSIRNFRVFHDLAHDINRLAPNAMVLNYTNPMTVLTDVLCRICDGPVVGLCHGLFENLEFLKRFYKLGSASELAVNYAGLNHFFWMTDIRAKGRNILADLRRRLRKCSLTDLLRESSPDPMGYKSARELATELFRNTGIMPYLGDRHTCEFFAPFITSKKNLEQYRLQRTTIAERRKSLALRKKELANMIRGKILERFLKPSRETAADIISAHSAGGVFIDVGNVPNIGQISNLPSGTIVETAVRVDANGFAPIAFGPLPDSVIGFVEPYAHVFQMTAEACFRKDRELAMQALRFDPVCSHLNGSQVRDMAERLLHAHRKFIGKW